MLRRCSCRQHLVGRGLAGSIGQGNYATAKAGIALLTIQQAAEWGRYGVLANAWRRMPGLE